MADVWLTSAVINVKKHFSTYASPGGSFIGSWMPFFKDELTNADGHSEWLERIQTIHAEFFLQMNQIFIDPVANWSQLKKE